MKRTVDFDKNVGSRKFSRLLGEEVLRLVGYSDDDIACSVFERVFEGKIVYLVYKYKQGVIDGNPLLFSVSCRKRGRWDKKFRSCWECDSYEVVGERISEEAIERVKQALEGR